MDWGFSQVSSIGNLVWDDRDCDGELDLNELGIPGVVVRQPTEDASSDPEATASATGVDG